MQLPSVPMISSYQRASGVNKEEIELKDIWLASYSNELTDISDVTKDEAQDFTSEDLLSFSWQIAKGMVGFCFR